MFSSSFSLKPGRGEGGEGEEEGGGEGEKEGGEEISPPTGSLNQIDSL